MFAIVTLAISAAMLDTWGVKLILGAGSIYAALQLLKMFVPAISGKWAIWLNVAMAVTYSLSLTPHDQLWTFATLQHILTIAAAAAGIHGTMRSLKAPDDSKEDPAQQQMMAGGPRIVSAILFAALFLPLAGCAHQVQATTPAPPPVGAVDQNDADANRILRAVHDFQAKFSADIQAGKIHPSQEVRDMVNRLNDAVNKASTIEQAYHNAGGGDASQLKAEVAAVQQLFLTTQAQVQATAK